MSVAICIKDLCVYHATKSRLVELRDEARENARLCEDKLKMLAASNPKTTLPQGEDWNNEDWVDNLPYKINNILEEYKDNIVREYLLTYAIENKDDVYGDE